MKILSAVSLCLLLQNFQCLSQQTPSFFHQYLNKYLLNPAAAGKHGDTKLYLIYRNQWVGVEGAPETFLLALDGRLKREKLGFGITVINDVSNIMGRLSSAISASYTVDLSDNQEFSFGMSLMAIQNRVFFDKIFVDDLEDLKLIESSFHRTIADCNIGFSYRWNRFGLDLVADQVFQNEIKYQNIQRSNNFHYKFIRHYLASIEYKFNISNGLMWKPQLLAFSTHGIPPRMTVVSTINYEDKIWVGSSYRWQNGIGITFGMELEGRLLLSYGYEVPISSLRVLNTSTHEIVVGIRLNKTEKNSNKLQPQSKETSFRTIQRENLIQYEKIDVLEQINENQQNEIEKFQEVINDQHRDIAALRKKYESIRNEIDSLRRNSLVPTNKTSKEVESDYYLVVGAFRKFENARIYQRVLKRDGGLNSRIIQNNRKTWYLIYTEELEGLTDLDDKINILENGAAHHLILGKPWVFTKENEH